jgi:hypothetical protein
MSVLLGILLGVVGILGLASLYKTFHAARQLARDDGRLRLKEVARARNLALLPLRTEAAMHADALAVRRCVACQRQERCDELAAARDWAALRALCPNTPYLDGLGPR